MNEYEKACHERWIELRHLPPDEGRECMGCRFYVSLRGPLGMDWGVCSNPLSRYDGRLCFEHDGCDKWKTVPYGKAVH